MVENFEKYHSNVIYFKKENWLEDEKLASIDREIDFSSLDGIADKLKSLLVIDAEEDHGLRISQLPDKNDSKSFTKFRNLDKLYIEFNGLKSIENNFFHSFKDLSCLEFDCNSMNNLPELMFSGLAKLRNLKLTLNEAKVNKNHFKGLENLEILELRSLELDEDLEFLTKLKKLILFDVKLNKFTLHGLVNNNSNYLSLISGKKSHLLTSNFNKFFSKT